jgi:hypothetical protein
MNPKFQVGGKHGLCTLPSAVNIQNIKRRARSFPELSHHHAMKLLGVVAGALLPALAIASPIRRNDGEHKPYHYPDHFRAPPPPPGGLGTNNTPPVYRPGPPSGVPDFDFQSLNLALNQEYIELDLFHHGLAVFSEKEFDEAGINAEDRFMIQFMAEQESGHAEMISNILGRTSCSFSLYTPATIVGYTLTLILFISYT